MADIELVIKIPEAQYAMIKEMQRRNGTEYMNELEEGVANGTLLPKGHGRLIDADALYKELIFPNEKFAKAFKDILDDTQRIIEAESEDKNEN